MQELGKPFYESSEDLLVQNTCDIVSRPVAETMQHIRRVGQDQYEEFVVEWIGKRIKSLSDHTK